MLKTAKRPPRLKVKKRLEPLKQLKQIESVSSKACTAMETFAIMTVRQLPPSESLSSRVSLLSRYGTWLALAFLLLFLVIDARRSTTDPSAQRLWLMFLASSSARLVGSSSGFVR